MVYWWDPFEEIERMRKRMLRALQGFVLPVREEFLEGSFPVDIEETDDELVITAELPGFDKDDIAVSATENTLEISAQHKEQKIEKTKTTYKAEKKYGALKRMLSLPVPVKFEESKAEIKNGLLKIKLPKKEKKKIGKKIKVE